MIDTLIDVSSTMARAPTKPLADRRIETYTDAPLLFSDDETYTTEQLQQPYNSPASQYLSTVPSPDEFRQAVGNDFNRDLQQQLPTTTPPPPTLQQQQTTTSSESVSWGVMGMNSTQLLIFMTALCTGCLLLSFVVSMMSPKNTGTQLL